MWRYFLAGALSLLCVSRDAWAQDQAAPAASLLRLEARARLVEQDTSLDFRTRVVPGGRFDVEAGVLRAAYRIAPGAAPAAATPEAAARAYLSAEAARFGFRPQTDDLVLVSVETSPYSSHLLFEQVFFGLPVHHRRVKVNLDAQGRPTMVLSGYAPHLARINRFDATPSLSPDEAVDRVRQLVDGPLARTTTPELVVYPSEVPRLAWRLLAWPAGAPVEWEVLVDAHTGELIQLLDQGSERHGGEVGWRNGREESEWVQEAADFSSSASFSFVDGSGSVFDPDPLTRAGVSYGKPFSDSLDADIAELNAQREVVTLRDITQGPDGLYRLQGPYVRVDGTIQSAYTPPAEADPHAFHYGRANPFFEAVMVYYHIDKSQRYLQTLDVGRPIMERPIRVNPHGYGNADNARFLPGEQALIFGRGGVDDAEDASVIWHEYAHALLHDAVPGLLASSEESRSFHEGWADYWAASYVRSLIESGAVPERDWRDLFFWDGNNRSEMWCGRRLDHPGRYPNNVAYTPKPGCSVPPLYQRGLLWATTLMDIYPLVGRHVLDRLNLASHAYLMAPVTYRDAAEAIIQADQDLYGGAHVGVLLDIFGERGYVDPSQYRPVAVHDALPDVEQLGGTVAIEVRAEGRAMPIEHVFVHYGFGGAPTEQLALEAQGGGRYTGRLPLPETAATVSYYVEVVDTRGGVALLPEGAPAAVYQFYAGPDTVLPVIGHQPVETMPLAGWPLAVAATVEDNLGVDSVWVEYEILGLDGSVEAEGVFGLRAVEGGYRGTFPGDGLPVQEGSVVRYRVRARDRAQTPNHASLPASGMFAVEIVAEGVLRSYSFEGVEAGVQATGEWRRGAPTFGLRRAYAGNYVWSTALDTAYAAAGARSSLELAPLGLQGVEEVYLVFWHWYDFEHDGTADPAETNTDAAFYDGANVKVSIDGGRTWEVLPVEGGYPGTIIRSNLQPANPLGGEPGFGGYSYGWRRVIARLPTAADVRVRFDFGTDANNTGTAFHRYAGWAIDEVTVTTRRPEDVALPEALLLPPPTQQRGTGQTTRISVTATDDTGVEAVFVDYVVATQGGLAADRLRLAMNTSDRTRFEGQISEAVLLQPGDQITYRITLRDFDGNERTYPQAGEPFVVAYRTLREVDALVVVRPSGPWERAGKGWVIEAGDPAEMPSSLVLAPIDLPRNADALILVLDHAYALEAGAGGNLHVSDDGGATWRLLAPREAYPSTFPDDAPHAMRGEGVFSGSGEAQSTFDLTAYLGRQVQLRLDFGTTRALTAGEHWTVRSAALSMSSLETEFETPRETALLPNFPDPVSATTTISYTIGDELVPVRLAVFDALGRRVAVLIHAEHIAGTYTLTFDASRLAGGMYFIRMEAGDRRFVEKMVVLR